MFYTLHAFATMQGGGEIGRSIGNVSMKIQLDQMNGDRYSDAEWAVLGATWRQSAGNGTELAVNGIALGDIWCRVGPRWAGDGV